MPDLIITVPWWVFPAQIGVALVIGTATGLLVRWILERSYRK
jgi:hypothetical protein